MIVWLRIPIMNVFFVMLVLSLILIIARPFHLLLPIAPKMPIPLIKWPLLTSPPLMPNMLPVSVLTSNSNSSPFLPNQDVPNALQIIPFSVCQMEEAISNVKVILPSQQEGSLLFQIVRFSLEKKPINV
jgi:hypothetical protein